jgi:hypothetical protein
MQKKNGGPTGAEPPFRLEIGFAHAVGPALYLVLGALLAQVAPRLAAHGSGGITRQGAAATQAQRIVGKLAGGRQLHAGNNARSARYGLERIGPENHDNGS